MVLILFIIAAVLAGVSSFGVNKPIHLGWAAVALIAAAFAAGGAGIG